MLGWLVGRFVVGLVSCLVGCFFSDLVWLVGLLVGTVVGWLVGLGNWLFSRWVGLLVEWFLTVGQLFGLLVGW